MNGKRESNDSDERITKPPFLYEIRVKGRLATETWMSWFDELSVSTGKGETTLHGKAQDHAALYGLLARLRDLAIPLVSVKVLDADAQRRLSQTTRRIDLIINGLIVALYLALLATVTTITVFVAPVINPALAIALMFAALGGLAHVFWLWTEQTPWRWISYAAWIAALFTFAIFIPVSGILPTSIGIAVLLLLVAGGLFCLIHYLRRLAAELKSKLPESQSPDHKTPNSPRGTDDVSVDRTNVQAAARNLSTDAADRDVEAEG